VKDTDKIEIFDPIERVGGQITIGQLKEHLFGVKQEISKPKSVPKKTETKNEK